MTKPYTVALNDAAELPVAERIAAEVRFIKEIERALGGADEVVRVYRAWIDASESDASELDGESASLAVRWPKAMTAAARAGMRNLGEMPEAHFELRLERAGVGAD
ncbi:MAG: hypothetical protein JWQ13_1428 [Ramlibacter sp.]|jgi:hypothetical protein|nr:hypothetical protein [Ramlibacter sp.]